MIGGLVALATAPFIIFLAILIVITIVVVSWLEGR